MKAPTRSGLITLLATAGFLAIQSGWILSVPPYLGIDEYTHAERAASVAAGHWRPGSVEGDSEKAIGELIPVRRDVVSSARTACTQLTYTAPANCHPVGDAGHGEVFVASTAALYNPAFYAVVGTVARPFHGTSAVYAMRVATALLCAALFAMAVRCTSLWSRSRWPVIGLFLAVTPTTIYSASVASPNGLNMLAGLALWAGLLGLVRDKGQGEHRGLFVGTVATSGAVLANTHSLGVAWLILIVISALLVAGRDWRRLVPRRGVRELTITATAVVAVFVALSWTSIARPNNPAAVPATAVGSASKAVLEGLVLWPLQAIATFPTRNEQAPMAVYAIALLLLIAFAVVSLRGVVSSGGGLAAGVGFVALMSYGVPAVLTLISFRHLEAAWQGRYGMPFTAGLLLLFGLALEKKGARPTLGKPILVIGTLLLGTEQVLSQWHVVKMEAAFDQWANNPAWLNPSLLLLGVLAVVSAALWSLALLSLRESEPVSSDEPGVLART